MKVGDLVKPGKEHVLRNESYRRLAVVLEHHKKNKHWNEYIVVCWNDGDLEPEIPYMLEIVSERA